MGPAQVHLQKENDITCSSPSPPAWPGLWVRSVCSREILSRKICKLSPGPAGFRLGEPLWECGRRRGAFLLVSHTLESATGKAVMAEGSLLTPWPWTAKVLRVKTVQKHLGSVCL